MTPGGAYRVGAAWPRKPAISAPLILDARFFLISLCLSVLVPGPRPPRFAGRARCGRVFPRGTKAS